MDKKYLYVAVAGLFVSVLFLYWQSSTCLIPQVCSAISRFKVASLLGSTSTINTWVESDYNYYYKQLSPGSTFWQVIDYDRKCPTTYMGEKVVQCRYVGNQNIKNLNDWPVIDSNFGGWVTYVAPGETFYFSHFGVWCQDLSKCPTPALLKYSFVYDTEKSLPKGALELLWLGVTGG